jgi:hypothetical protein
VDSPKIHGGVIVDEDVAEAGKAFKSGNSGFRQHAASPEPRRDLATLIHGLLELSG